MQLVRSSQQDKRSGLGLSPFIRPSTGWHRRKLVTRGVSAWASAQLLVGLLC